MRDSPFGTPRFVCCFDHSDPGWLRLPRGLREEAAELIAAVVLETVDFARVEVVGVLRKKGLLAGRLTREEFTAAVRVIDDLGVVVHEITADRPQQAAARAMLRMYDALFVQLAIERPSATDRRRQTLRSGQGHRRDRTAQRHRLDLTGPCSRAYLDEGLS